MAPTFFLVHFLRKQISTGIVTLKQFLKRQLFSCGPEHVRSLASACGLGAIAWMFDHQQFYFPSFFFCTKFSLVLFSRNTFLQFSNIVLCQLTSLDDLNCWPAMATLIVKSPPPQFGCEKFNKERFLNTFVSFYPILTFIPYPELRPKFLAAAAAAAAAAGIF